MDPISAVRDHIASWLDESLPPTVPQGRGTPAKEPDYDAIPTIDRSYDEFLRPSFALDTAKATPEDGAPEVRGRPYTDNPREIAITRTSPNTGNVISALQRAWPGLTEHGARTLAAQHALETGDGSNCYNWNLGNMKAGAREPHMYLQNVWEACPPAVAARLVDGSRGLARVATDDEVRAHGWSCPAGHQIVVFQPPHDVTRFRACGSLAEGVAGWVDYYQRHPVRRDPTLLDAVNRGDTLAVAHSLKLAGYYSGAEGDYANGLQRHKAEIDRNLGPLP